MSNLRCPKCKRKFHNMPDTCPCCSKKLAEKISEKIEAERTR
jgi:predicted amidophosphoribosyltransferase